MVQFCVANPINIKAARNSSLLLLKMCREQIDNCIHAFLLGDISVTKYCQINLDKDNYRALAYAVRNHYWYQMYIGK